MSKNNYQFNPRAARAATAEEALPLAPEQRAGRYHVGNVLSLNPVHRTSKTKGRKISFGPSIEVSSASREPRVVSNGYGIYVPLSTFELQVLGERALSLEAARALPVSI